MRVLLLAIFICCFIGQIICAFFMIKNSNTHKKRAIIIDAFYEYVRNEIRNGNYDCGRLDDFIEDYDNTFYRICDWGYSKIVPPDVFEKIAPFIEEAQ